MHLENLRKLVDPVCKLAIQSGKIILEHYKSDFNISLKKDKSPVTIADLESNRIIRESLSKLDKNIPILSEESLVEWVIRKNWKTYWLVYAPALKMLYFAFSQGGSYKILINQSENYENFSKKAKKLINKNTNNSFIKIICSRSHPNDEFSNWLKANIKDYKIIKKGSSLKFCNIAEGSADIYPRFRPSSEWDIAAGHIILNEAGGKLQSIDQKKIFYNLKESVINPYFIASCKNIKNV